MSDTWTIGELAEHAARALRDGAPPANGRVRDVPGERLIRWYTTIGLVDPPLTRRGRIARYGRRHLLQLVAIKRLQAAGHAIAEIQTALAGATDRMLEDAAALPDLGPAPGPPVPLASGPAPAGRGDGLPGRGTGSGGDGTARGDGASVPERPVASEGFAGSSDHAGSGDGASPGDETRRGRFWAERPSGDTEPRATETVRDVRPAERGGRAATPHGAPGAARTNGEGARGGTAAGRPVAVTPDGHPGVAERPHDPEGPGERAEAGGQAGGPEGRVGAGALVVGVRLGDGVRLVWDGGRTPSEEDVQAVLAAAGPLLAVLEERDLK
jgi:DNA-binding transcriptional MerR regulator